jgi:DNA polymerase-3 subunit alpha (Gram-positive type)
VRDAVGGSLLLNLIVIFTSVVILFFSGILAYSKAYKVKNKIIEIQNKGYEATNKEMGQLESLKVCLEATARGIKFLPVDLNNSNATVWGVKDDKSIYPPFASIEGLGDTVAKNIVEEREKRDFLSIEEVQYRAKVSGTLIEKMKSMGIFDGMSASNQLSLFDL